MQKIETALFLFRRDLRCEDNTGLILALDLAEQVLPAFIFTPDQVQDNPYKSDRCFQFMLESLQDLENQLKKRGGRLYLFYGEPEKIVTNLPINALIVNRDYTPYSIERDKTLKAVCKRKKIPFYSCHDALLQPPEETVKGDGDPYQIFTPFYRNASKLPVLTPQKNRKKNYFQGALLEKTVFLKDFTQTIHHTACLGGRKEGLKLLKQDHPNYFSLKDIPAKEATTHLSAHLKFTTLSPREVYRAFDQNQEILRSLYWRDFYTCIAYYFPYVFHGSFHRKYDQLKWSQNKNNFQRWCDGLTGFPIVDAGMRQLAKTGFMHNRVRMIAASFLIKDLHIDWRLGEKYFAQTLIDYDPAVNNGNWQWCASTGCDAQPYFRIFNPWNQQKKFDPDCLYIKKWLPELNELDSKTIHLIPNTPLVPSYPIPMLDHSVESKKTIHYYKSII